MTGVSSDVAKGKCQVHPWNLLTPAMLQAAHAAAILLLALIYYFRLVHLLVHPKRKPKFGSAHIINFVSTVIEILS